jgi:hypothetical protein
MTGAAALIADRRPGGALRRLLNRADVGMVGSAIDISTVGLASARQVPYACSSHRASVTFMTPHSLW